MGNSLNLTCMLGSIVDYSQNSGLFQKLDVFRKHNRDNFKFIWILEKSKYRYLLICHASKMYIDIFTRHRRVPENINP